jgi:putative ABC transport system substrate-binding protein
MNRRDSLSGLLALGMAAHSPGVFAQAPATTKRVGFLSLTTEIENVLRKEVPSLLAKSGWIEGSNISYQWRHAAGNAEALPALAEELLAARPDVIVADTNRAALVAMRLTRTTPIVVYVSLDPVDAGLIKSLVRPGGNVTGLMWGEPRLAAKIVEFLHQAVPRARRLAVIYDENSPGMRPYIDADINAAHALGMESRRYAVRSGDDLAAVLKSLPGDQIDAIKAALSAHTDRLRQVLDYSSRHGVPAVSSHPIHVRLGALLAYYPDASERLIRLSALLGKLLRGARPSEIPFEYPSRFHLAVNLRTAAALGITIPQSVLLSASLMVE